MLGPSALIPVLSVLLLIAAPSAQAQTETLLYSFNSTDGSSPYAGGLIFDGAGNLFGTTWMGGDYGYGAVFQLVPGNGGWTENVLHSFNDNGEDGYHPYAGLILDTAGNLYGTTVEGGAYGAGTVFQLTPGLGGVWTETMLHNFNNNGKDGAGPLAGLTLDADGNLYGTTENGGAHGGGTVFQLALGARGKWKEKILHNFNGTDGGFPFAGVIFDAEGNLYGTTYGGGASGKTPFGTVFQLKREGNGGWAEKVLHAFNGTDGGYPEASLIFDADGNLYGTANGGGASGETCAEYGCGTVFQLAPPGIKGKWTETVLHIFSDDGTDGYNPASGLIFDAAGNVYGTTNGGGTFFLGSVFELTPEAGGTTWTETVPWSFGNSNDGFDPYAGLVFDTAGNLYGTTHQGGDFGYGAVFEIRP